MICLVHLSCAGDDGVDGDDGEDGDDGVELVLVLGLNLTISGCW